MCRQLHKLDAPSIKERCGRDEERVGPVALERRKCGIDLAASIGGGHLNLQTNGAGDHLHFSQLNFRFGRLPRD